jgi:hypothetical protein
MLAAPFIVLDHTREASTSTLHQVVIFYPVNPAADLDGVTKG